MYFRVFCSLKRALRAFSGPAADRGTGEGRAGRLVCVSDSAPDRGETALRHGRLLGAGAAGGRRVPLVAESARARAVTIPLGVFFVFFSVFFVFS